MSGISTKAEGSLKNKKKFQGNEEQCQEFSDGSGLEILDFHFRMYDNQVGRFWQIDPLIDELESWSPFTFCSDNPILRIDPYGLKDTMIKGEPVHIDKPLAEVTVTTKAKPKSSESQSGLPLSFVGFAGSWGETKMFNQTTWYSLERMRSYKQGFHSNQYTSPKAKPLAKNISKGLRYFGWGLGLLNQFQIFGDDKMSGQQKATETASNVYSTFGGIYGAAWGIGWEMGRGVTSNQSYRENFRPLLQKYLLGGMDEESKEYEKMKEVNRIIDAIEIPK